MENLAETDRQVTQVIEAARKKGLPFPSRLSDMPGLPVHGFDELLQRLRSRELLLQRFSVHFNLNIFSIFASPAQKRLNTFYMACVYLVPLGSLALASAYRWWFGLGFLSFFWFLGRSKKLYNTVIFQAASRSELYFCFLYVMRQIGITPADYGTTYYWNQGAP